MNKIAQVSIPGYGEFASFPGLRPELAGGSLGSITSSILELVFVLTGILMFIWALVGIFQYITAGGNKEGLAKARARITWAIVGFIFVMLAFSISLFIQQLIKPISPNLPSQNTRPDAPGSNCVEVNGQTECP